MIPDDKTRIVTTITKEQEKELCAYCKKNNITKSAAVSIALGALFACGYKVGDIIGQMIFDENAYKDNK